MSFSKNETPEEKLRNLIGLRSTCERTKKQKHLVSLKQEQDQGQMHEACALQRAFSTNLYTNLETEAKRLGFSSVESRGIMDGWDSNTTLKLFYSNQSGEPGYIKGFALGNKLFKELGAK